MASSPMSPLSSLSSEDILEDAPDSDREASEDDEGVPPPTKRPRVAEETRTSPPDEETPSLEMADGTDDGTDISSDSSGSVPGSPRALKELQMPDEVTLGLEQVRNCSWEGCAVQDLASVDELVAHLNDEHVRLARETKYTCEWSDCRAKGKTQMSAYALKAHLRSHTKEKPFYCLLPECDRSFTRSDALAKHIRTVHETESARTNEHYSKQHGTPRTSSPSQAAGTAPPKPLARLKLVLGSKQHGPATTSTQSPAEEEDDKEPASPVSPSMRDEVFGPLPAELEFTADESSLSRRDLFRLLRRKVHWAEVQKRDLTKDIQDLDKQRKSEWMGKELVFENALEAEFEKLKRKRVFGDLRTHGLEPDLNDDSMLHVNAALVQDQLRMRRVEGKRVADALVNDVAYLPITGQKLPWYREDTWRLRHSPSPATEDLNMSDHNDSEGDIDAQPARPTMDVEPAGDDTEVEEMDEAA